VLERQTWLAPTKDTVLATARSYREAIEAMADAEDAGVLVRGLKSFLNLDEVRQVLVVLVESPR
jgi:hypothetical protein